MARNRIADITFRQSSLFVSTTGYTGEPGCELLCVPGQTEYLWNALLAAGAKPIGLAARDTLRLEQGYCLSGSDFTAENNPLEARIGWAVCLEREFCGRDAIAAVKAAGGPTRRLTALLPEGRRIPRHGAPILRGGQVVGEITSGGQSPTLNRPIALGYVATEFSKPGGQTLQIDLGRGQLIDSTTTRTPFVKIQHGAR
jgi:aminomethyltransferase